MTAEFSMSNNLTMINRLIIVLGKKFCLSSSPNARKGGLLGLAAVMVGFKNGSISEPPPEVVEEVVCPILSCFIDSDPRVRYYACESLYNVTKVAKGNILPQFERVFDNIAKVVADPDTGVRTQAEILDKLLKDIMVEQQLCDDQTFTIPQLENYIYTKNPFTRMLIISWIRFLDSKIDIVDNHLPKLLDGIFNCLCDSTNEIRASTLSLLSEFLNKIVRRPDKISIPSLINTLLKNAKNGNEDVAQYTAIAWLRQFIELMNDSDVINFTPGVLVAILPCLAGPSTPEGSEISYSLGPSAQSQSPYRVNICEISSLVNSSLLNRIITVFKERKETQNSELSAHDLEPIIETLVKALRNLEHPIIKIAILDWFKQLKKVEGWLVFSNALQRYLTQVLLDTLSARSDIVVKNALRVIVDYMDLFCVTEPTDEQSVKANMDETIDTKDDEIPEVDKKKGLRMNPSTTKKVTLRESHSPIVQQIDSTAAQQTDPNISQFIRALYRTFRDNDIVFESRGTFIILNLCSMVKQDEIYRSFAKIIEDEKSDFKFAYNLVQKLNQILLTTQPLFGLRSRLSNEDDPDMTKLFYSLYDAWCHSPIAALTLCLLTNNYKHANEIVAALAQMDVNMDILTEIDWVVQLVESPVFSSLRMRLLDSSTNQYLLQSLYGLLMILPQSEAYKRLGHRLDQVYKFISIQQHFRVGPTTTQAIHKTASTTAISKELKKTKENVPPLNSDTSRSLELMMSRFNNIQNQRSRLNRASENDD